MAHPPLVLIHGLWDTPRLFRHLVTRLDGHRDPLLIPHLSHRLGHTPLLELAQNLGKRIDAEFGPDSTVDVLGFSMGGLIARAWIQEFGGYRRTRRFLCVGSPQRGTLTAQLVPRALLAGIADMKIGSAFIRRLQRTQRRQPDQLAQIDCRSYFCALDLMVIPSWLGVLPVGTARGLPAWSHPGLVSHPASVETLAQALLEP